MAGSGREISTSQASEVRESAAQQSAAQQSAEQQSVAQQSAAQQSAAQQSAAQQSGVALPATWLVVSATGMNVRREKDTLSPTIGKKRAGARCTGRIEEGWLALSDEPGYLLAQTADGRSLLRQVPPGEAASVMMRRRAVSSTPQIQQRVSLPPVQRARQVTGVSASPKSAGRRPLAATSAAPQRQRGRSAGALDQPPLAKSSERPRSNALPHVAGSSPYPSAAATVDCVYDVVLRGKIFTGTDGSDGFVECMAFSRHRGLICFVGSYVALKDHTDKNLLQRAAWCRVYTTPGLVLPAFHDAHAHPFGAGNRMRKPYNNDKLAAEDEKFRADAMDLGRSNPTDMCNLSNECTTWDEVVARLQSAISKNTNAGNVLFAEKCQPEVVETVRHDVAQHLEALAPGRIVVVLLGSPPEAVVVSSSAMRALQKKLDLWTFTPEDERIERKKSGEPTGYFGSAIWATRFALLSPASVASQGVRGLKNGLLEMPKHGIVACTDAFVFDDRVPCYEMAFAEDVKRLFPRTSLALGFKEYWDQERLGSIVASSTAIRKTWEDTDFRYCLREAKVEVDHSQWGLAWEKPKLASVVHGMIAANFSIHMHVFFSEAVQHSLKLLLEAERHRQTVLPQHAGDRRHKLAHAFEILAEDAKLLCQTPFIHVVYQPAWFSSEWAYNEERGTPKTHEMLVGQGASVCYGSDWDISELSPLQGIASVLAKADIFDVRMPWRERLVQAFRLYSLEGARAMWLDSHSGTLEVGKFADFCVLNQDIFEMTEAEVCALMHSDSNPSVACVGVMATFSRGFCIFRNQADLGPWTLERYRSGQASATIDPDALNQEPDEVFLCGTCDCTGALGHGGMHQRCCT